MNRFAKTLGLLVVSLVLLISGVDSALDRLAADPLQSAFTLFNQKGEVLLAYDGKLAPCDTFIHYFRCGLHPLQAEAGFAPRA